MAQFVIGIDIGTQGTKATLFSGDGDCVASAFIASSLHRPAPGVVEEDPEVQYESVLTTIGECMRQSGVNPAEIAGIAMAGQMAGVIGVDADGRHVTPYDSWLDTRCTPYIAKMVEIAGDEVLSKTGCPPSVNHGPKILWWKHERPEIFAKIKSFVQPGGYAAMRLCGLNSESAFLDKTYLHFCGFADTKQAKWDAGLCARFDVPMEKLPRIVEPTAIVGEVASAAAARCGLRAGIPVIAGCGDTVSGFLACGATQAGICVDVAGTASVFSSTTDVFQPDLASQMLVCGHSFIPGLWHSYAYISGGGMNLEWFRKSIANHGEDTGYSFEDLNRMADAIAPGENDPYFIPHVSGRVCPSRPNMRGGWIGVQWDHSIGHLYRAVLEGVALEYALYARALKLLYPNLALREMRVTGGGEKCRPWNQIKADVLGIPVVQITRTEGGPLGAALLAALGAGLYSNIGEAAHWITTGAVTEPDSSRSSLYEHRLRRYSKLLDVLNL